MVAQGRNYLQLAWWLAFFPGLIIMLVALSLNLLSSWLRIVLDPRQRWRLENIGDKNQDNTIPDTPPTYGKESVSFLKMVKENLEDPRRLFLNI